jgi:hypothetical protein
MVQENNMTKSDSDDTEKINILKALDNEVWGDTCLTAEEIKDVRELIKRIEATTNGRD